MMSDTSLPMRVCRNMAIGQALVGIPFYLLAHLIPYVSITIFIGAVLGMVSLKVRENYLSTAATPEALESHSRWVDEKCNPLTEFDCTVYDQSTFERRLIEAGIMKADELIICDSLECLNCAPERKRRKEAQAAERRQRNLDYAKVLDAAKLTDMSDERRKLALALWDMHAKVVQVEPQLDFAYKPNHERAGQCKSCRDWTTWDHRCPTCVMMREDKRKAAAKEKAETRSSQYKGYTAAMAALTNNLGRQVSQGILTHKQAVEQYNLLSREYTS